ncbi:hypothetical protein GGF46_004315 [Coemansia sp. RSA 552]|nr:hypothetical protein GGF46_004315 [Coemansia sp. RSA 552]
MRGAEWLDDEEKHSHQLTSFDIQEKTVDTATAATGSGNLPGDNGSSTPKTLFKKRRTPANLAARKQQKQ